MTPSLKYEHVLGVHRIVPAYNYKMKRINYGLSEISWIALHSNCVSSMKRAIRENIRFNKGARPLKGL